MARRIAHRFLWILILLTALPLGIMGAATYGMARRALIGTALMHMETIAEDHKNHLDFWYRERLQDLASLAALPLVRELCRHCATKTCPLDGHRSLTDIRSVLLAVARKVPFYDAIVLQTPDGRSIVTTFEEDSEKRPPWVENPGPRSTFGTPVRSENGQWYVTIRRSVRDRQGNVVGIILARVNLSRSLDPVMTDRAGLGRTGRTYLITPDRHIITHLPEDQTRASNASAPDSFGIRRAIAGGTGSAIYRNHRGRQVVGAYVWLPQYQLAVIAEMETSEILSPVRWMKLGTLGAVVLLLVICFGLAQIAAARMSRPIEAMSEAARRMADGDFSVTLNVDRQDELGVLAESFNHMARKTAETLNELRTNERSLRRAVEEQKALQAQLVQSEKLAAIGELVAGIVHEMRNPLSSIKLNLQILKRAFQENDQWKEHFTIALDQVALLENMFRDLLDFSKPLKLQRTPVSVEKLLDRALDQVSAGVSMDRVRIRKRLEPELPHLFVDEERIVQVLVNVIKNAVENRSGPLEILLEAECLERDSPPGWILRLKVQDDGPGIPPQHLPRLFQPFFTTRTRGTGLGLSIVRKIMEAHGGTVRIESRLGKGTVVFLDFPIQRSVIHAKDSDH